MKARSRQTSSGLALLVTFSMAVGTVVGCSNNTKDHPKIATTVGAVPAGTVKPGSYEDWCPTHQVPESLCTRCSPQLSGAFQATGDWCVEHGLPESQCRKCNPQINIVRPPKTPGG